MSGPEETTSCVSFEATLMLAIHIPPRCGADRRHRPVSRLLDFLNDGFYQAPLAVYRCVECPARDPRSLEIQPCFFPLDFHRRPGIGLKRKRPQLTCRISNAFGTG